MKKYLLLAFAFLTLGMTACTKSYTSNQGPYINGLQIALTGLGPTQKTFIQNDAEKGFTLTGNSGTRYVIPPNAFQNSNGTIVTGQVDITTAEFLTKTDMLFSGFIPYSPSYHLVSGGEVYFSASQNGNTLTFTPDLFFQAIMPSLSSNTSLDTTLYVGSQDYLSKEVIWTRSQSGHVTHVGDSVSISSNFLGFNGADNILEASKQVGFTVTPKVVGATITDTIAAFAVYDNYNGIFPLQNVTNHVITVLSTDNIPVVPMHFVIMTIINGNFYAGTLGVTPQDGSNYQVPLVQTSPEEFKFLVQSL